MIDDLIGNPTSTPTIASVTANNTHCLLWACLEAQTIKNLPARQETWVQSLGWEDPLEKGTATYSSILAWRILVGYSRWVYKVSVLP